MSEKQQKFSVQSSVRISFLMGLCQRFYINLIHVFVLCGTLVCKSCSWRKWVSHKVQKIMRISIDKNEQRSVAGIRFYFNLPRLNILLE